MIKAMAHLLEGLRTEVEAHRRGMPGPSQTTRNADGLEEHLSRLGHLENSMHCKASEANMSLKTASCEAGPGTTLIHIMEICIWSLLIQEYDDGYCFLNSICASDRKGLYQQACQEEWKKCKKEDE
jgi:hypothetical protein